MNRWMRTVALSVFALAASSAPVLAQQEYPATLYWGTGLIDIPVAWVPPLTGDFSLNYGGKRFEVDPVSPTVNYDARINSQLSFSMAFMGRFELGVAAYSANPEWGFFGRGILVRQEDFVSRLGWARWLVPGIGFGVRNVGPFDQVDRFAVGYQLLPPVDGSPNRRHVADSIHENFKTATTVYGVATKSFSLAEIRPAFPDVGLSLSVGYGNGLFQDDGGHGDSYSTHSTGGLFYGAKVDFSPGANLLLSLMAENNAWDYNLGASLVYRGLRGGVYVTELGAGSSAPDPGEPTSYLYNYQKVAFTVGWQTNLYALLRGEWLANRADALRRQREQLLAEVAARQQRIASLELEINRYEAQSLLELEQRRLEAQRELEAEREAVRQLEERLRRIEQRTPPPPRRNRDR
ncbi:MAG TPA: hypothetical protein VMM18_06095 [Gemmatimonadaceae bacterium]|nr:hypothetical protein [Gemmatimonadaceae bacterium]